MQGAVCVGEGGRNEDRAGHKRCFGRDGWTSPSRTLQYNGVRREIMGIPWNRGATPVSDRPRRRWLQYLLLGVIVIIGVVLVAPLLVPRSTIRHLVLRAVDRQCLCTARVRGAFTLTFWPTPTLRATRLEVENVPGLGSGSLVMVRRLALLGSWSVLLDGRWTLERTQIVGATVILGQSEPSTSRPPSRSPGRRSSKQRSSVPSAGGGWLAAIARLGGISIHDAAVIEARNRRILLSLRHLRLGRRTKGGERSLLVAASFPMGSRPGGGRMRLALRGWLTLGRQTPSILRLTRLSLRDPILWPGTLKASNVDLRYGPLRRGSRLSLAPVRFVDPRFGRLALRATARLDRTALVRLRGTLDVILKGAYVRRRFPELRPVPGANGLRLQTRFVADSMHVAFAPYRWTWGEGRREASLEGRLLLRRRGREAGCWKLVAKGMGVGFMPSKRALRARTSVRASQAPATGPSRVMSTAKPPVTSPRTTTGPVGCIRFDVELSRLRYASLPISFLRFDGTLRNGALVVPRFTGRLFGGVLTGTLRGTVPGAIPTRLVLKAQFHGIDLAQIHRHLEASSDVPVSGILAGAAHLSLEDPTRVQTWGGRGTLRARDLVWKGIDFPAIVQALGALAHGHVPRRWPRGGSTSLGSLRTHWRLEQDTLDFPSLVLESSWAIVRGKGHVTLRGQEPLDLRLVLARGLKTGSWPAALRDVPIPLRVTGTLAHPEAKPVIAPILRQLLLRRLRSLLH